jgi:magnesium-transporting ATPase (P-type)
MTAVAVRTAEHLYRVTGVGYAPDGHLTTEEGTQLEGTRATAVSALLEGAVLCNDSALTQETKDGGRVEWTPNGAPTEVALLTLGAKAGLEAKALKEAQPRLLSVPFESEHKFMASVQKGRDGERVMYVKGAPDRVIPMCTTQVRGLGAGGGVCGGGGECMVRQPQPHNAGQGASCLWHMCASPVCSHPSCN